MMESILNFFRVLDTFAPPISFRFRERKKYESAFAGFFIIPYLIFVIIFSILSFIPFVKRKNYTIVYYTMNLAATEEVNIFEHESNFAVGLSCDLSKNENTNIFDLLVLKANFVLYQKYNNGSYAKFNKDLSTHKCTYKDFYNKYNNEYDYLSLSKYECVDNKYDTLQGIYSDEIFSYFEFSVLAKDESDELLDQIESFLYTNDCKLNFAYTDIIIDLDDYKSPITTYLNQIFIQLNPSLFIKRNIYYMNQYFTSDNNLMYIYGDLTPETKPLYSRYEEYSLYQGLDRKTNKPPKYEYFSKIYLRADLKKTIIKRKYQRLMEFYASTSCLLMAIFKLLNLVFSNTDEFYRNHSITKFIFFFKDLEDKDNYNISKKSYKIKEIISIMDSKYENFSKKVENGFEDKKSNTMNNEDYIPEINLYKTKKTEENKNNRKQTLNTFLTGEESQEKNYQGTLQKIKFDQKRKKNNTRIRINYRNNDKNNLYSSEKIGTTANEQTESNNPEKSEKKDEISNSFNFFELLITQVFNCCLPRYMKIKKIAFDKAKKIMFKKLDVVTYIRNTILFDLLNQSIIDEKKKTFLNFISRPIISVDTDNTRNEFDKFYDNFEDKDLDEYCEQIKELVNKPTKEENDMKLLFTVNEHIKAFT